LILALGLLALFHIVMLSCRYLVILRGLGLRKIGFLAWFRIFVTGSILNYFLGQSGNVYRAMALKKKYGFEYTNTVATYIAFAWMDTLLNTFLITAIVALWDHRLQIGGVKVFPVAGVALVVLLLLPFAARILGRRAVAWTEQRSAWLHRLVRTASNAAHMTTRPSLVAAISGIGLGTFGLQMTMVYIAFRGLGINLGLAELAIFVGLLQLSAVVIITPGNLGIIELAYGFLSQAIGFRITDGFIVSGILRMVIYAMLLLFWMFLAATENRLYLAKVLRRICVQLRPFLTRRGGFAYQDYCEERYSSGGSSGSGSRGALAQYKADVINEFIRDKQVNSVIEFGCGDGTQLKMMNYREYLGLDVAKSAIELCHSKFRDDPSKNFVFYKPGDFLGGEPPRADLVVCLDVLYHITNDADFEKTLDDLFSCASKHVILYTNIEARKAAPLLGGHIVLRDTREHLAKYPEFEIEEIPKHKHEDLTFARFVFMKRKDLLDVPGLEG